LVTCFAGSDSRRGGGHLLSPRQASRWSQWRSVLHQLRVSVQFRGAVPTRLVSLLDMSPLWTTPGPIRVPVHALDQAALAQRAQARTESMRATGGRYRRTSMEMNTVGLYGEYAVERWLSGQGLRAFLHRDRDYRDAQGDVSFGPPLGPDRAVSTVNHTVEAKTSRFSDWKRIGRALNARQFKGLHADVVFWCVVADELPSTSVMLMGWLPVPDIRAAASNETVSLHGEEHVRVHEPLRDPAALIPWSEQQPSVPF
jgi:hypothetical protein